MATLSEAIAEAYASADPAVVILHTIELYHPSWASPIRLVQDFNDLTATLEADAPVDGGSAVQFTGCPFSFTLPQVGEGRQELQVAIDNVGLLLMPLLESADLGNATPVLLTYRPYLTSDTSAPHMTPPLQLNLLGVSITTTQVVCTCAHANWGNRRFPRHIYTVEEFPGVAPRV